MTVRIRPMEFTDLDGVLAIERASFRSAWSRGMFLDELTQGHSRAWFVAGSPWGLMGYAGLMEVEHEGHIMNLAVRPDARRSGIGGALLSALFEEAARRRIERLTLEVRPSNEAALALYTDAGFTEGGRRHGYYGDSGEDALVMWSGPLAGAEMASAIEGLATRSAGELEAFRL